MEQLLADQFPTHRDVFCPFLRTYQVLKDGGEQHGAPEAVFRAWVHLPQHNEVEIPMVLRALVHRLSLCGALRARCDRRTAFRLQLFEDEHLDLLDELLELVRKEGAAPLYDESRMVGVGGLVQAYEPCPARVPSCYRLPDMVSFVRVCNLRYDVIPDDATIVGAVCHVLAKATNHNCLPRNASDIYSSYSCSYPVMDAWVREMVQVSLLGNYPWATVRPSMGVRLMVRRAFRRRVCPKQMHVWMQRHEKIVRYCTREYHAYLLGFLPLVEDVLMSRWCPWRESKDAIRVAMDTVRQIIGAHDPDPLKEGSAALWMQQGEGGMRARFKEATAQMESLHDNTLQSNHKLFKGHWCSVFLTHLVDKGKRFGLRWEEVETSPINYHRWAHDLSKLSARPLWQVDRVLQCASEAVRQFSQHKDDFRVAEFWLRTLGMGGEALVKLRGIHSDYTSNHISDNSLASHLWPCITGSRRDQVVLLAFLFKVHADIRNASFRLPDEIAEAQRRALRARIKVPPAQEDPPWLGDAMYCEKCEEWRTPVASLDRRTGKGGGWNELRKPIYSNGIFDVMYDLESHALRCKKKGMSRSSKRRKKKQQMLKTGKVITDKQADIMLQEEDCYEDEGGENRAWRTCCCHPITTVNMLGRVKKLRKNIYCLCAYCGSLTYYNARTLDSRDLPNCGMHLPFLPSEQVEEKPPPKTCIYCHVNVTKEAEYVCIMDDTQGKFYFAYLCRKDARQSFAYRKNQRQILLKSTLFRTIHAFRMKNPVRRVRVRTLG